MRLITLEGKNSLAIGSIYCYGYQSLANTQMHCTQRDGSKKSHIAYELTFDGELRQPFASLQNTEFNTTLCTTIFLSHVVFVYAGVFG